MSCKPQAGQECSFSVFPFSPNPTSLTIVCTVCSLCLKERLLKTPPEEEEEAEEGPESWQELLDSVKENMEQNGGICPLCTALNFDKYGFAAMVILLSH